MWTKRYGIHWVYRYSRARGDLGELLFPTANDELQHRALPWSQKATRVVLAQHGFDACVIGGVATVYQAILAQPGNVVRSTI